MICNYNKYNSYSVLALFNTLARCKSKGRKDITIKGILNVLYMHFESYCTLCRVDSV